MRKRLFYRLREAKATWALLLSLLLSGSASALLGQNTGGTPVILISVDTLRPDHLSCYGHARTRTPRIDAIGDGGTRFTDISTQVPLAFPSHVSLFTSTFPLANGIQENVQSLRPGLYTLAT